MMKNIVVNRILSDEKLKVFAATAMSRPTQKAGRFS